MQLELSPIEKEIKLISFIEEDVVPPPKNSAYDYIDNDEDYYYCNYGTNPKNWPR